MQKFAKCFGKHLAEFEKATVSPVIFPVILQEFLLIWQEFLLGAPFSSLKFEPAKSILSQKHLLTQYTTTLLASRSKPSIVNAPSTWEFDLIRQAPQFLKKGNRTTRDATLGPTTSKRAALGL
jgi:hypothetical protein